jgi:hypothetical protein
MKPWHQYTPQGIEDLAEEALNAAVRLIQDRLGVETGDFAGLFFSGALERATKNIFQEYINAELKNVEEV